ncbi:unnamed protein product [Effrenium voratum]|nr:unnamed protein product [Effrenium voratum]
MAPGRIVLAPNAPQHILDMCRALKSPRLPPSGPVTSMERVRERVPEKPRKGRSAGAPRRRRAKLGPEHNTSVGTLFSGERMGGLLTRGPAVTFRRPERSGVPPHTRPIFMASDNGTDAKVCVDVHNPRRFSSTERCFSLRGVRHLDPMLPGRPGSVGSATTASSRPMSAAEYAPLPAFLPVTG